MCVQLGFQLQCAVPIQYSVMRLNCTEPSPMQYPTEMHFSSHTKQHNTNEEGGLWREGPGYGEASKHGTLPMYTQEGGAHRAHCSTLHLYIVGVELLST